MTVLDSEALGRLVELIGDDPADLIDMMESFLADADDLLALLILDSEPTVIGRAAHSLKSNARDFGATTLATLCERLERDLKTGQTPVTLSDQLDAIRSAWPPVKAAIKAEIAAAGAK